MTESAGLIAQQAIAIGGGVFAFVVSFFVGLYVAYFLLRDGKAIGEAILRGLPLDLEIGQRLAERFLLIVRATIKGSFVVGLVQGGLGAYNFLARRRRSCPSARFDHGYFPCCRP